MSGIHMTQPLYQASTYDPVEFHRWGKAMFVAVLLAAFLMALKPVRSPDVWHHIASGRYVAENGGPARADPFSCTAQGKPWIQYEWLAQYLIYQAYDKTGVTGLVIFRALLLCVVASLLIATVRARHRAAWAASGVAVTIALLAASPRFFSRPEIFTFILFSAWRLCGELVRRGRLRYMVLPPLFMAIWVNMHGAWPAGLAWLGLIAFADTLMHYARPQHSAGNVIGLWIMFLAGILATFINPYTWRIWEVPFALSRSPEVIELIAEWHRPDLAHWIAPAHLGVWFFLAVILLSPRTVTLGDWLVIGFFGLLSLTARRHLALAMIILAPISATQMSLVWRRYSPHLAFLRRYGQWRFAVAAVICLALVPLAYGGSLSRIGVGVDYKYIPIGSSDFLAKNNLDGNLFNNYEFGNYLIFARYPRNHVFIDGRVDMYGRKIVLLYDTVRNGKFWQQAFGQFNIHLCVLSTDGSGEKGLISALHNHPDWALVFWDGNSCVYVQRTPGHEEFLRNAYVYIIRPDEFDMALFNTRNVLAAAERDYLHKLQEDPDSALALYGLGMIRLETNRLNEAETNFKRLLELKALLPKTYGALGVLYNRRGDTDAAVWALENARALDPRNWQTRWNLSVLYEEQGRIKESLNEARAAVRLNPQILDGQARIDRLANMLSRSAP